MAIPTISTVFPSTVWTGGQLVVVTGTNFRVPTIPAPQNLPLPDPIPTAQVLCDGVAATEVAVHSATRISCRLPGHDPTATPVVIVVQNLNDAGTPIAGETATKTTAVSYARPDLSVEDDAARVDRAVIRLFKRLVLENVVKVTHPDFGEEPFEVTLLANVPALVLAGPTMLDDAPHYTTQAKIEVTGYTVGLADLKKRPLAKRFDYTLTGYTNNESQNLSLMMATVKALDRSPFLYLDRDSANPAAGQIRYPIEVPVDTQFRDTSTANKDGNRSFTGGFSIRGVLLEDIASFPGESTIEKDLALQTGEILQVVPFVPA